MEDPRMPVSSATTLEGSISRAPIWLLAVFFCAAAACTPFDTAKRCQAGDIERVDARFDAIVAADARLECLADGFAWVEGPVWSERDGVLFFTDIPANAVYRLHPGQKAEIFLEPAGYSGMAVFGGREPGANGLAIDAQGRMILCEHGDRRVTRLEPGGGRTVLADRYEGKRLNSPNDVVLAADGSLYFTDPPFGLPGGYEDPTRELDFTGVFRRGADGNVELVVGDLGAPNGVALSPDGRTLYVSNSARKRAVVMAYALGGNGLVVGAGWLLFDATPWLAPGSGVPDGMAVDSAGNVFLAGPGGVHVLASDGTRLGLIRIHARTSNVTLAEDRRALYVTASSAVYRMNLLRPRDGV
jgi:gluconolactonase